MGDRRPTIIDVAAAAGVSKSTVSLVIQKPESVKPATKERVLRAMADLGYVYNRAAATMRSGKMSLIGLIINNLRNPFFTEFATSLQMALSEAGYAAVLANTDEDEDQQRQMIEAMIEHNVAGLVISPAYGDVTQQFDDLHRAEIPTIQVMRQVEERTNLFPFIAPDYFDGGRQATRWLIDQGAQHIAFVGGVKGHSVTTERMSGYLDVLEALGRSPLIFNGRNNRDFGRQIASKILIEHPEVDAVLCFNDFVALGVSSGLREASRLASKNTIRIVGFDDIEEVRHAHPPISSVQCGINDLAKKTARKMLDWLIEGRSPEPIERSPTRFVNRGI